ncbi:hypothetical protein JCM37173_08160 [Allocoprococcus similis]
MIEMTATLVSMKMSPFFSEMSGRFFFEMPARFRFAFYSPHFRLFNKSEEAALRPAVAEVPAFRFL